MDSMFEDDISILTPEALGPDEDWLDSPTTDLSGETCSASHFALVTAYDDIKNRLTGLERENSALKRRLKMYELKFPLMGEFGEEQLFSLYEAKETSLLKSEKATLQQQLNQFQHELQKSKEREEQLDEMIQAYEKLCVEKSDLESELAEMRALVETHLSRIRSLEQQLRQRDGGSFGSLGAPLPSQDVPFLPLHGGPGLSHVLDCPVGWPGRSLEQLEAELEAARQEAQRAQHREEHLGAECERLQAELKQLQESRAQEQSERDMAWVKKVGDEQVNLALAYTELTEELCRLRSLSALQSQILRALLQDKGLNGGKGHAGAGASGGWRAAPAPPGPAASQRHSPLSQCHSPAQQRRSPGPQAAASPHRLPGERAPLELGYAKPSSRHIKASFQGRRSYSEVSNGALFQQGRALWLQPEASTLPKPRPYGELYAGGPREPFEEHVRFEKQSSDEDEWAVPSPPSPEAGAIRCASFCAGFPIPAAASAYARAEHAQSWPSINLLLETADSDIRSCPLCQLAFPVGYPDDALIKHIDSHLENSKI
ncbi:TANK-binding kinase 1-binding protein 1 [Nothoprocta perdicaria]|uniref:TANK-binding kinase 1-binding protein 1 n=1 Tax=Nothoprocta perdicaria TaxID=30464 RepID=UPI000E1BEE6F|nr:TANK-binding kinase 1-binding protein 1 [Nothoprocta perdicaria]